MIPAKRLDCPRCLETLAVRHYVRPRPPTFPTGRRRTFRGRLQAEMGCTECGYTWWSRHYQALELAEALAPSPLLDLSR